MVNVRFASALQMTMSLSHGAELGHPLLTSTELAEGLNANPTAVRALVSLLAKAGIVESFKGKSGGVRLKKSPERISLKDIYVAVTEESSVFGSRSEIPHRCKVTRNMKNVFGEISESAEKALLKHLSGISLSQIMSRLK
jgi:Rrf2 family transcriptional repressor of oqxAB